MQLSLPHCIVWKVHPGTKRQRCGCTGKKFEGFISTRHICAFRDVLDVIAFIWVLGQGGNSDGLDSSQLFQKAFTEKSIVNILLLFEVQMQQIKILGVNRVLFLISLRGCEIRKTV